MGVSILASIRPGKIVHRHFVKYPGRRGEERGWHIKRDKPQPEPQKGEKEEKEEREREYN